MAAAADILTGSGESGLAWLLRRADLAAAAAAPQRRPTVLVCDLDDPDWAPLQGLTPSDPDLADASRPGAAPRLYFQRRRSMMRSLLAWRVGVAAEIVTIGYDEHGAPRALTPGEPLFVSVSSRGRLAALAVAGEPIGVDLEPLRPPQPPICEVLHPNERRALARLAPPERHEAFLRLWTMKEAYLKSLGCGLTRDPATIAVDPLASDRARLDDDGAPAAASVAEWRALPALGVLVACFVRR